MQTKALEPVIPILWTPVGVPSILIDKDTSLNTSFTDKLIDNLNDLNKKRLIDSYNEIKTKYINLSKEYQLTKEKNFIPLK